MNIRNIVLIIFFFLQTVAYSNNNMHMLNKSNDSFALLKDDMVNAQTLIDSLISLGKMYRFSDPDKALKYAQEAHSIAGENELTQSMVQATIDMAIIYISRNQYYEAKSLALTSKAIAQKEGFTDQLAESYAILGCLYFFNSDYSESSENLFTALRIYEESGNLEGISILYSNLGSILVLQEDFDKALEYYQKSITIAKKANLKNSLASVLNNTGVIYGVRGEYEKSISYFEESIKVHEELNNLQGKADCLKNLGKCYQELSEYGKSIKYFNQAMALYNQLGCGQSLAQCYNSLADHYIKVNSNDSFLQYSYLSYSLSKKNNYKTTIKESTDKLHIFYKNNENWDSAYKYAIINTQIKDSIGMEQSKLKFANLEFQYKLNKQQQEDKLDQQRKDFYLILLAILFVSSGIMISLFFSKQKKKIKNISKEKKELAKEVEMKNKELVISVMNMLKKKEFFTEMSSELLKIEKQISNQDNKQSILRFVNEIKKNSEGELWADFEMRFKKVHSSFEENLLKSFPGLTSNELKLCALLRLNLSTKEIVTLTGLLPSSIDVARYRLRKKLGLTKSTTKLISFLSQF